MPTIKHLRQPDLPGMPRYSSIFGYGIRGDYLAEKQIDLFDGLAPPAPRPPPDSDNRLNCPENSL